MWKKVESWILRNEWWLLILLGSAILRVPSLIEPYWYGDEGIYLAIGKALNNGIMLYRGIHDNKPPLLYLAAAIAGGNQFWFRAIAMLVNLTTVAVFARLAERFFEEKKIAKQVATWIFAILTSVPFWEGNIANAELFFLLPNVLAFYILFDEKVKLEKVIMAGLVFGIGGLFKMPALFEVGIWPLFWLRSVKTIKEWWGKTLALTVGVLIPIVVSVVYYFASGAVIEYLRAAWLQNIPYLSSWKVSGGGEGIFSVSGRAVVLVIVVSLFTGLSRTLGKRAHLIGLWGVITLFAALLSGRPYPHYLLQMAGAVAIAATMIFEGKFKEKIVSMAIIGSLVFAIGSFKFYFYPTTPYYVNFLEWVWGARSKQEYYGYFGNNTNDNYEIAAVIKAGSKPGDKIFIWGDQPILYPLSERLPASRYIVKYHISDFDGWGETVKQLTQSRPMYIVNYEGEIPIELEEILNNSYLLEKKVGGVEIYRHSQMLSRWYKL